MITTPEHNPVITIFEALRDPHGLGSLQEGGPLHCTECGGRVVWLGSHGVERLVHVAEDYLPAYPILHDGHADHRGIGS